MILEPTTVHIGDSIITVATNARNLSVWLGSIMSFDLQVKKCLPLLLRPYHIKRLARRIAELLGQNSVSVTTPAHKMPILAAHQQVHHFEDSAAHMEGTELRPAGDLSQMLSRRSNRHARELRDHGELNIMRASTKLDQRSFGVSASQLWNTLPETVTASSSLLMFKTHLKTLMHRQSPKLDSVWTSHQTNSLNTALALRAFKS
jgi:hypothetical protein